MAKRASFPLSTPVPEQISLSVGDEVAIELVGLGTAGYRWREQIDGETAVVSVTWLTAPPGARGARPPGASASETAVIRADNPGQVGVVLLQARPWESAVEPARRIAVTVTVVPST